MTAPGSHENGGLAASSRYTALYSRVTREESIRKGLSLPNQRKRFLELASQHGWEPTEIYEEAKGLSGELPPDRRPKLRELLKAAQRGEVDRVVVRHLDRLARGDTLVPILTELHAAGIEVRTFDGVVDGKTAAGRFVVRVQGAAAAFETERGGERVREAKRSRARDGIHVGRAPYGYTSQSRLRGQLVHQGVAADDARVEAQKRIPVSPGLVVDEEEAKVVLDVYDRYVEQRQGTRIITRELNARGIQRRGSPWHVSQVVKLLHDPKVAGWTTFDEEGYQDGRPSSAAVQKQARYPAKHQAIVSQALFEKAERLLGLRRQQLSLTSDSSRTYPLTGVLKCSHGHGMKGKSGGNGSGYIWYVCRLRARAGTDADSGGCDAPNVKASDGEAAVRNLLSQLLSSTDTIMRAWQVARDRLAVEAPERKRALVQLDAEMAGLEREREAAFAGLRDVELAPEQYAVIADRAKELNERIRQLQEQRSDVEQLVVPIKSRQLSKAQVEGYLGNMAAMLEKRPEALRELLLLMHIHHGLTVTAVDSHNLRLDVHLDPISIAGNEAGVADLPVKVPIMLEAQAGQPRITNEEWASLENEKGHTCACGCGARIKVRPDMRAASVGIPKVIQGHHRMDMTAFVEALNAEGLVTVSQAAKELGVGETTLRRAEERGWIKPGRRSWGGRQPMRVYRRDDLPGLREKMKSEGFRFEDDDSVMTTKEMAAALGIPESRLRHMERTGKLPRQKRGSGGKRMWQRKDVGRLNPLL